MSEIESLKLKAQQVLHYAPTIVLGSGYSAAYGLPTMGHLAKHLKSSLEITSPTEAEVQQIKKFKTLVEEVDLETAINRVGEISERVMHAIVSLTWGQIRSADEIVKQHSLKDLRYQSLSRLIGHIFNSSQSIASIVTTNYDRLSEYAVGAAGFNYSTGFRTGLIGVRDEATADPANRNFPYRTVKIWKVHGSIDWFSNGSIPISCSLDSLTAGFNPLMITPGEMKYRLGYKEPFRTVIAGADISLSTAQSYICIGYGFNDDHIQQKLVERVTSHRSTIAILAMELTASTRRFIESIPKRGSEYIAIQREGDASKVFTQDFPNGVIVPFPDLWSLDGFLKWSLNI